MKATVDGLVRWGDSFYCDRAASASSTKDIESVAHELGHWIALGRSRAPGLTRVVSKAEPERDLGVSIEAALGRMSTDAVDLNEIEAAAISLGALDIIGVRKPRGIYGQVWGSLQAPPRTVKELRATIARLQRTRRIKTLTSNFLFYVEAFS